MVASVNLFRSKWLERFHLISLLKTEVSFYWLQSQGSLPLVFREETNVIMVNFVTTSSDAHVENKTAGNTNLEGPCPFCERHLVVRIFRIK